MDAYVRIEDVERKFLE